MPDIRILFEKNRAWSEKMLDRDAEFFHDLSQQQAPRYLWIGCADSRVPANEIVGLKPGELFVHRNVANVVVHTDLNCLSVLQYAVDVLQVKHVIVCGHYGCGGVRSALNHEKHGLIDNWLRHIQDIHRKHAAMFHSMGDEHAKLDLLCELNVIEQVENVALTTVVQDAWARGQELAVHGWVYGLDNGIVNDLAVTIRSSERVDEVYEASVKSRYERYAPTSL
jgi:carbonic anhydrase